MKAKIILSAGMPRSGSTWLFNAVRLLLLKTGYSIIAKWIDDFNESDLSGVDIGLIKIHEFDSDWISRADFIVYSYRDIRDAIASAERKFSRKPSLEYAKHLVENDYKWKKITHFVLKYESLLVEKESIIKDLSKTLNIAVNEHRIKNILDELDRISYYDPGSKNDKYHLVNLLHTNHITNGAYGTWKNQLDEHLIFNIEKHCYQWFEDFGYGIKDE